ncbi:hypothetical protein [Candidatus Blochmannia ocreatus (nom. nud.)]|uniref:hypothetical protein n=1 Tax=Candidatus Blochmannia ocreatus (nom. nud.) TaxID=251538 RepID=UPI0024E0571E|nr:hypothetical protein [Candidatus Blochmannia ocreatus]
MASKYPYGCNKKLSLNGWIACRLSGTEPVYKIYCENFIDSSHKKIATEIIELIQYIVSYS